MLIWAAPSLRNVVGLPDGLPIQTSYVFGEQLELPVKLGIYSYKSCGSVIPRLLYVCFDPFAFEKPDAAESVVCLGKGDHVIGMAGDALTPAYPA